MTIGASWNDKNSWGKNVCGVYELVCLSTNERYIGSSKRLDNRFRSHKHAMINNKHYNYKIQQAYNKYGLNQFLFRVLLYCDEKYLIEFETRVIRELNHELNISPEPNKNAEESIEKTRKAKIGVARPDMIGNKYRLGIAPVNPLTPEQRQKGTDVIRWKSRNDPEYIEGLRNRAKEQWRRRKELEDIK